MNFLSSQTTNESRENSVEDFQSFLTGKHFETNQIEENDNTTIILKETNTLPDKFICSISNDDYSNPLQFDKREINLHECKYCFKKFNQKSNLKTHIRIHTGERPFYCTILNCHMKFKTQGQLKDHFYSHSNLRPFKCEICSQAFNRKSRVKRHMMIHTNIKPFKCEYVNCQKSFRQKGTLKTHFYTHIKKLIKNSALLSVNNVIGNYEREQEDLTEDDDATVISQDFYPLETQSLWNNGLDMSDDIIINELSKSIEIADTTSSSLIITIPYYHDSYQANQCE